MAVLAILRRQGRPPTAPARPQAPAPRAMVVVTRAETAPCTCPDACERDHEQD